MKLKHKTKKLKTILKNTGDIKYTKFILKQIELIKKACNVPKSEQMYFLTWEFYWNCVFCCKDTVYTCEVNYNDGNYNEMNLDNMELVSLYKIRLLKEFPKTVNDIEYSIILEKDEKRRTTPEAFLDWLEVPCGLNEKIDNPYYEIIKFLSKYNRETFRTERYLFYPKNDDDCRFTANFYAYDLKNKTEIKLYIPDIWEEVEKYKWKQFPPENMSDVVIDPLSQKISSYHKRECKKAFLKFANEYNTEFNTKNYWLMELTKNALQPINDLHEWDYCFVFRNFEKKGNIGSINVYDYLEVDEEPCFFITDERWVSSTSKIAVLNFKSPAYRTKGIYKRGNAKARRWVLDKSTIEELMEYLNAPYDKNDLRREPSIENRVKTNWQKLIYYHNHNTGGWDWGENEAEPPEECEQDCGAELLPFNLPIPDYTKLLEDSYEKD